MSEAFDRVRGILVGIGVEDADLDPHARLRADLGLDSTETTQLEIELTEAFGARVDLWDAHDHTLAELAELAEAGGRAAGSSAAAEGATGGSAHP